MKSGAMTRVIVASSFTRTWSEGPAVSLNGSPTVSPTTAAAWITGQRPVADGRQPSEKQRNEIAPEIDEECDQRPHVKHHVEGVGIDERVVPARNAGHEDEVRRGADGDELGQPLDEADDGCLQNERH